MRLDENVLILSVGSNLGAREEVIAEAVKKFLLVYIRSVMV